MDTPPRYKGPQPQDSQATDIESQQTQPVVVLSPDVSPIKTPPIKSPEGVAQLNPSAEKMGVTNVPISQPDKNESSEFDDEPQGIRERSASQSLFVDDLGTPESLIKIDDDSTVREEENVSISSEGQSSVVGETDESMSSLVQQYDKVSNELENFFFNRVEGLFEYLLFLILYEQLDILGPDKKKVPLNQEEQTGGQGKRSAEENLESGESKVQRIGPQTETTRIEPVVPTNCNNFRSQTPSVKNILILKLYKELNHDFKGSKSLDDIDDIRETYLEFLESLENVQNNESDETKLYKSLRETTGEWSFYTSMLEYFIEDCNGFNDLTMIRYKSITNNYTGEKQFLLKDINAPPESINYVNSLFNGDEFKYRFQDNGTPNEVLKRIVQPTNQDQPNPIDNIQVIENAPSLIDPATCHAIHMKKFYPNGTNFQGFQDFQKCQDLNYFDNNNNTTILDIMKGGISQFFGYFESSIQFSTLSGDKYTDKYKSSPVKFIVVDCEGNEIRDFERYSSWINRTDQNGNPYYYKGVRIKDSSNKSIELHVGDSAIPNICSLVNSNYYLKPNRTNPTPTEKSWNRLIDFAQYIINNRNNDIFDLNDREKNGLRLVIIALKSFGDSFQVFYSTAIQKSEVFLVKFPDIATKTYLSSSDKNVGAEKMFYNSPFLLNGCGIQPYQSLRERFPYFFEQNLSVQGMDGDIGHEEDIREGASKAILTNIKQENRDYKPMIQLLSNNILGILEGENQELINEIFPQTEAITMAMIEAFANNMINVTEVQGTPPEEIYKKLQKIYNSLKLVKEQNNVLDEKIDFLMNSVEEQNQLLLKMIARKHEPTTKELEKLNERLTNNDTNILDNSLDKLINVSCLPSSSLQGLQTKMNEFKESIRNKLQQKKTNLSNFIKDKLPTSRNTTFGERASRTAKKFYNGLMDFVSDRKYYEKKLREMAGLELQGGKIKRKIIKTIKHRIKKHKTRRENPKIPKNVTIDKKQNKIHKKTRRQ